jgi:hypothetical protein
VTAGGQLSRRLGRIVINPTRSSLTCLAFAFPIVAHSQALPRKAPHFFFRSDWDENFRDQDRFGHLLGGYQLTRVGYEALRASCVSGKRALIAGVAYAALFQLQIEVFDEMYNTCGFSYADVNALLPNRMQSCWPSLLRASIGHSITEYIDPVTGASHRARRKLLLSVDIDPEKLPGQLTPSFQALDWYR